MLPTALLLRNHDIIAAAVGEETILLNPANWTYVHFNETATRIWECLDAPRRVDEIVTMLVAEYAIEESVCRREVHDFAQEMSGRGFFVVKAVE